MSEHSLLTRRRRYALVSLSRRATGALVELACGDALGRPVEFRSSDAVSLDHGRVTEMLARSLVDRGEFAPTDVARRFADWLAADPFDVGLLTAEAVHGYHHAETPADAAQTAWEARPEAQSAGNGSLMRYLPPALVYDDRLRLAERTAAVSALTHADPRCVESCVALTRVVR
jgi:ADP-ribosyl-[dinitrogen reductase] hydrolase